MVETKDKIVTLESLAMVHAYNEKTYMQKNNNVLTLVDLDTASDYNPNDFVGFILKTIEFGEGISQQILFTNKISNNSNLDVKFQSFQFGKDGIMFLYELHFYLEQNKYKVDITLTNNISTNIETTSISNAKLYGIKII